MNDLLALFRGDDVADVTEPSLVAEPGEETVGVKFEPFRGETPCVLAATPEQMEASILQLARLLVQARGGEPGAATSLLVGLASRVAMDRDASA